MVGSHYHSKSERAREEGVAGTQRARELCEKSFFIQGLQTAHGNLGIKQGNQFSDLTLLPSLSLAGAPQWSYPAGCLGQEHPINAVSTVCSPGAQGRVEKGEEWLCKGERKISSTVLNKYLLIEWPSRLYSMFPQEVSLRLHVLLFFCLSPSFSPSLSLFASLSTQ